MTNTRGALSCSGRLMTWPMRFMNGMIPVVAKASSASSSAWMRHRMAASGTRTMTARLTQFADVDLLR